MKGRATTCATWLALALLGAPAWAVPPDATATAREGAPDTPAAPATGRRDQEREAADRLDAVRDEIKVLTAAQRALQGERSDAGRAVRDADEAVNREAQALAAIDTALEAGRAQVATLEAQQGALQVRLQSQREALAQLLRSAYATGRHEQLKLLLAQDRLEQLARVLAYHRYFQRDRVGRIEGLLVELRELAEVGRRLTAEREALARARAVQAERIAALELQRGERRALLAQLETRFDDARARLAALGKDERALLKLLESLRDVFADIPAQIDATRPFAQRRGALRLPLAGKRVGGFGERMPDGRRSQGWLIAGRAGTPVGAVAPGRVAFADWLNGYGLIVILDHGDGYMSLYAQNDSLLKEAGDWVGAGDALAGVGSSGGQAEPALYFELRLAGKPVDPTGWFAPR